MSDKEIHAPDEDLSQSLSAAWRVIADKALRGADFEDTLVRLSADGIRRGPVFFSSPHLPATKRLDHPTYLPWQIRQTFTEASLVEANAAILADLNGGVSQIGLHIDPAGERGIPIRNADDLSKALADVDVAIAPVYFEPGSAFEAADMADRLREMGAETGGLGLMPDHPDIAALARTFEHYSIVSVDARSVHEAGGSEAQEIAYAASGLNESLASMLDGGIAVERAASQIEFLFAADADIHLTIAKLRAARLVLGCVLQAYDCHTPVAIRAITSARMMTRQDPWTNIIRLSAAAFAGTVGGADAMSILPATFALGRPDSLARRTARNLHILLQEESHTGIVSDPAAGSFLHDTLSETIARRAWDVFQATERQGGFSKLGDKSGFGGDVSHARDRLASRHASKEAALVGVSKHAAPDLRDMKFAEGIPPVFGDDRFAPIRLEDLASTGGAS